LTSSARKIHYVIRITTLLAFPSKTIGGEGMTTSQEVDLEFRDFWLVGKRKKMTFAWNDFLTENERQFYQATPTISSEVDLKKCVVLQKILLYGLSFATNIRHVTVT